MMVGTIAEYASCPCGEYHRAALRRLPDGWRCFNCSDTRHRHGQCSVCGAVGPLEEHHPAGWRHCQECAPNVRRACSHTIPTCLNCHRILSRWQYYWHPTWLTGSRPDLFTWQGWLDVLHLTQMRCSIPSGEMVDPPPQVRRDLCIFIILAMIVGVVLMLTAPHRHQDDDIVEPWRYP